MMVDKKSLQQIKEAVKEVVEGAVEEVFDRKFDEKFGPAFEGAFEKSFGSAFESKNKPFAEKLDVVYEEIVRLMQEVAMIKYDDIPSIKSDLEQIGETLDEHGIKITRIVRLMPDVRMDIFSLNERVARLEGSIGITKT